MDDRNLDLKDIVPEYESGNFLVRKLFWDRLRTAVGFARPRKGNKYLDMGTGSGNLIAGLLRSGCSPVDIYGIDFNRHVLSLKKRFKGVHFRMAEISKTGFPAGKFDTVFCLDVLEHIEDLEPVIAEIKRITKKKGLLVISVPRENFLYKLARFLIKGTFSMESGPGSGTHYHTSDGLILILRRHFRLVNMKRLRVLGIFNFFTICSFRVSGGQGRR